MTKPAAKLAYKHVPVTLHAAGKGARTDAVFKAFHVVAGTNTVGRCIRFLRCKNDYAFKRATNLKRHVRMCKKMPEDDKARCECEKCEEGP